MCIRDSDYLVRDDTTPIILCCDEEYEHAFRKLSTLRHLLPVGIKKDPAGLDGKALLEESLTVMDGIRDANIKETAEKFGADAAHGKASDDFDAIGMALALSLIHIEMCIRDSHSAAAVARPRWACVLSRASRSRHRRFGKPSLQHLSKLASSTMGRPSAPSSPPRINDWEIAGSCTRQRHATLRPIAFSAFNGSFDTPSDGDGAVTLPLPLLFQTGSFIPPLDRSMAVFILMHSCSYV